VPGASDIVRKLCDEADIVVENFRPGTLRFFGLDYETLSKTNERLIYVSITGYGQGGPWNSRMAYAPTVQAESGFTSNTARHFGGQLGRTLADPLSHGDLYGGVQATVAVLAALQHRERTGRGQYIDVAMAAVLLAINERAHVDLDEIDTGAEPAILGATDGPQFVGPKGERFVAAQSIVGSLTFPNYLRAMRRADLARDPRFDTAEHRIANYDALHEIIQKWIYTFSDLGSLDAQLDESKIAVGVVRSLKELAETEWASYWGAVREIPDRSGGSYHLPGHPWHFSECVLDETPAPAFQGEHNDAVLLELGLTQSEIENCVATKMLIAKSPLS
jgi:crotonobetainyl-CoA:carnitine CoA-transferase CaiB-like acyl-CoA transferase